MPADLNRVSLVGRLTRDPELRHTDSGQAVCSLRLAVASRIRETDGTWSDKPNFFDVTVFVRQAETAAEHLVKGRRIAVDGRLAWREWKAGDGSSHQGVEIIAGDLFFLDGPANARKRVPAGGPAETEDDVPF